MKIKQLKNIPRNKENVYNLEVEDNHNYYVNNVLVSNCHTLKHGNKLNKIIELFPTKHRFGFTGTLPESQIDKWNLISKIGPITKDINSAELRETGILTNAFAQILQINYKNSPECKPSLDEPTKAYLEECNFIYQNTYRNNIITNLCKKFNNNALIMVDKLDHGLTLYNLIQFVLSDKKVFWIHGDMEMEEREKIRELMEIDNNIICIAMSKIFSTGINIKNLHYIIFAQGGKAKVTMIQSIGRGLRKHESKDLLVILDIADNLHYSMEHLGIRLGRYDEEKIQYDIREFTET